jgi:hypothetical protein
VCRSCNNRLGREVDEVLLRTGTTGFLRHLAGVVPPDGPASSVFERGAMGVPPIAALAAVPGGLPRPERVLTQIVPGTQDVDPITQIIFEMPSGALRPHRITQRMRGDTNVLRAELQDRGMAGARPVGAIAHSDETEWVGELFREIGGATPQQWEQFDAPEGRVQVEATVVTAERYLRGIAKLGFHFTLAMFPQLTGHEREFDGVRSYIWAGEGGGRGRPVTPLRRQFAAEFTRGQRPRCWMHILVAERAYDRATALVQLFAGPGGLPFPYLVDLGVDPMRVATPRERVVRIFTMEPVNGYNGVIEEPQVTNRIHVPPPGILTRLRTVEGRAAEQ